jgi:hypothetical protein
LETETIAHENYHWSKEMAFVDKECEPPED